MNWFMRQIVWLLGWLIPIVVVGVGFFVSLWLLAVVLSLGSRKSVSDVFTHLVDTWWR